MERLGGVPSLITDEDFADGGPDEKVLALCLGYLAGGLLAASKEERAAYAIQRAWGNCKRRMPGKKFTAAYAFCHPFSFGQKDFLPVFPSKIFQPLVSLVWSWVMPCRYFGPNGEFCKFINVVAWLCRGCSQTSFELDRSSKVHSTNVAKLQIQTACARCAAAARNVGAFPS